MSEPSWNALFGGDPAQVERGIDDWVAGMQQRADRLGAVRDRVEQINVTETSANGAVSVTVDAAGLLVGIEFTERAAGVRPQELSALVLGCVRTAQARIAERVQQVTTDELGADLPDTSRMLVDSYRDRFGDAPAAPAPRSRRDSDDFDDDSFLA